MSKTNVENKKKTKSYYLEPVKFVRDIVLGYVYLTEFDLEIIDTVHFQRLKDIRQLTCQHVYPSARHTRFEHSLGVMELTRQAIRHFNENKFVSSLNNNTDEIIFDEQLQFNAALAALLHDIGHCPFSHLGETEFNKLDIFDKLLECLKKPSKFNISTKLLNEIKKERKKEESQVNCSKAAKHELLSCIIILDKFGERLQEIAIRGLKVDFELIIRSILGFSYSVGKTKCCTDILKKNVIVDLINSKILDMDKLDYIMRDSWYTGIGTPRIDTRRLFKNMYLNNEVEYKLAFKHRAVPALQNMIESRDELYMYVYNHHTAVFSDFMCNYIFRRLSHNEKDFLRLIEQIVKEYDSSITVTDVGVEAIEKIGCTTYQLGIISKNYLFSPISIIEYTRSDSDLVSLFTTLSKSNLNFDKTKLENYMQSIILKAINKYLNESYKTINISAFNQIYTKHRTDISNLLDNLIRMYNLVCNYNKREYLKPWWKTNSEFTNFIKANFRDDRIREKLCELICNDNKESKSDEFRSQLAKNVSYITIEINKNETLKANSGLLAQLNTDEFFVIQRSARFLDTETIGKLDIALKSNEILGFPRDAKCYSNDFYIKSLANVIPQRDYYSMYAKNSFYVFSKPLSNDILEIHDEKERNAHYRFIEQVFIFVATTLIRDGTSEFEEKYCDEETKNEHNAHQDMYKRFKNYYFKQNMLKE